MAQVGEIVYQVQMDVAQLLTSQRQLDQRLRNMEGGFNRTTTAVNSTDRSMASLSRVAASLTAYLSASAVAKYAEAWTVLNNKLVNSIKAGETLAVVNQRVFDIAQESRSSLDGIATLYSRLERAMRSAGLSGQELGQITTTISKAMTVSGATAAESEGALVQLSQALASGVLRGQEFNSMSEQAPALMKGLADSLGVSIGKLRAMAGEGKLTTDVLLKAFREMGPTIEREFANTTQTMSQSLQIAGNNITKFFGESSAVKSFTSIFNSSVVTASESLNSLTNVLIIAAGVMGSRYAGALALAGAAQIKKARDTISGVVATRQAAIAESEATAVLVRKTVADKGAALSALNLAQAEYQVARGSAAEATALANVTRLKTAYTNSAIIAAQANNALSASQARVAATGLTMTNALKAVNWLLAPIGGPAGAAMLAGAAVYYFFQKTEEARKEASKFADELETLTVKMQGMNRVQLEGMVAKATQHMSTQKDEIKELGSEIDSLNERYRTAAERNYSIAGVEKKRAEILNEIKIKQAELDTKTTEYSRTLNSTGLMQAKLNGELLQGADLLTAQSGTVLPNAGAALKAYGLNLDDATRAKQRFNATSLTVERSEDGDKLLENLRKQNELLAITDDRQRAIATAKQKAEEAGVKVDSTQMQQIESEAAKSHDLAAAKKEITSSAKAAASAAAKEATEAEKLQQKIADLADATKVVELETKGLSREAAILEAVQKLGSKANAAQIAEITELAAKEYDLTQKIKDRKDAFEQNPRAKAEQDFSSGNTQLERQLQGNLITEEQYQQRRVALSAEYAQKIAEQNAKSVVTPVQEMAAQVDPVQALANEHARKLALIKEYENQKVITQMQSLQLMRVANEEYDQQRLDAQWEIWRNQNLGNETLAASFDAFANNASGALAGVASDSMSATDAVKQLANSVANQLINTFIQMGVEWVKSAIMGAMAQKAAVVTTTAVQTAGIATTTAASTTAAATTTAAWTPAAIVASIGSFGGAAAIGIGAVVGALAMGVAGRRFQGGPVDAGSMYRVGEGGKPEIFRASDGKQFMIPGDNGRVISNKDMGGDGGGSQVIINIQNYSSASVDARARDTGNGVTMDMIVADISQGGNISQAIERSHQAPRRATE
ncbi:tape measure protein [Morganella psychrotolerans]|uniref:Tape measure protein N-terminal domain-containing protein n=1 Tax=Morganella psychrotolerans TaxID=368603 RepID=A0A1B8HKS3_9GAMM|nr:tape measure protein [Morganella psychrotolerans]OBU09895.1 hypothetical protein AYY18_18975 [Morganella psychrotolerans]